MFLQNAIVNAFFFPGSQIQYAYAWNCCWTILCGITKLNHNAWLINMIFFKFHLYTVSQEKGCHPNHGYNFVNFWSIFKIRSLLQRAVNFQQNAY